MNAVNAPDVSAVQPPPDLRLHRLTVGQYLAMNEVGILSEDDRVELIEGVMVEKMPGNAAHATTQHLILYWLMRYLDPQRATARMEQPILLANSVPLPDVCVLHGEVRRYAVRQPEAEDVVLVIEVSDSTLNSDRAVKRRVYAGAGIAQMWIVNLIDRQIEVYTDPDRAAGVYRAEAVHPADGTITLTLDGAAIASCQVADLLP
jgi:Uma2 family endonuclease